MKKTSTSSSGELTGIAARNIIDSRRLLYFYHVARAGSFSTAETVLGIAQSAISRQIQQLETELDMQLLERHGRGVKLTQFGDILFAQASDILSEMSSTLDQLRVARNRPAGKVSIAGFASVMPTLMPEITSRFSQSFPDVEISVIQGSTGEVYDQLATGIVDVAILAQAPTSKKIVQQRLLLEPMFLVAARSHPIAKEALIDRDHLASLEMILPASPHGLRQSIDAYIMENGVEPSVLIRSDSIPYTKAIVRRGRLCTILPELSFIMDAVDEELVLIPFKQKFFRSVHVASLVDRAELPLVSALTKEVISVFHQKELRSGKR